MANPVLNDKRFKATAGELAPGWAAPTGLRRRDPRARRRRDRQRAHDVGERHLRQDLLALGAARRRWRYGWSQVTVDPSAESSSGLDLHPAARRVRARDGVHLRPEDRPVHRAALRDRRRGVPRRAVQAYEEQWSGIVVQAMLATMAVFIVCLALYVCGAVKVTNKFIFVVIAATAGIFLLYFASFLLSIFGVDLNFWNEPSPLGIGISVVICFVAALNLFVDFEMIRRMVVAGAPRQMEWYGAFGITVTIVWLYLEVLRLLSLLRD